MRRELGRGWTIGLAMALGLSAVASVAAGQEPSTLVEERGRVELRVMGSDRALSLTRGSAQELLKRLGLEVEVRAIDDTSAPSPGTPFAIATIEITPPLCSIVIVDGRSRSEIDRRTLSESSLETAVEAATHVVYFVVETMLEEEEGARSIATSPEPEPAPTPQPEPETEPSAAPSEPSSARSESASATVRDEAPAESSPKSADGVGFDLGATFSAVGLGGSRVPAGGGITGELRLPRTSLPLGMLLAATVHGTTEFEFEGSRAELRPNNVRLLGTFDAPLGSAVELSLAFGGSLEWLRLTPIASSAGVEVNGPSNMYAFLVTTLFGGRIHLGGRAFLSALAGLDVSPSPYRFVARVGDQDQTLLNMPRVRPMVLIGVAASLDNNPRFAAREAAQ